MDVLVERFECVFGGRVRPLDQGGQEGCDPGEVVPPEEQRRRRPPVDAVAPVPVEVVRQDDDRCQDLVGLENGQALVGRHGMVAVV